MARLAHMDRRRFRGRRDRGQVLILILVFFTAIAVTVVTGVTAPIARELRIGSDLQLSKQSYFTAEAGGEDAYYRIRYNVPASFPLTLSLGGATTTVTVETIDLSNKEIVSEGNARNHIRTVVKHITVADGFDFEFALQTGLGGISLNNNAMVNGNVYANGPVISSNTSANAYNWVHGSVVSSGPSGYVNQVHATGTVYSHTIQNATIDRDAYYKTFSGATSSVTVAGVKYPDSADQPPLPLPVSDTLVSQWESDAVLGGTVTCTGGTYTISASVIIGPKKIPCDLSISGNNTIVTLRGAVWVTGNITIDGTGGAGVQMKVDDSIGNKSVPVIADKPGYNDDSALITIAGNANFYGSTGNTDSYVILISQNNSAENGGDDLAMNVVNGATGNLLTYAAHGQIKLQNNVNLREVTAYKISLFNNAVVNYSIGLAQTLFTSGAGGSWKVSKWKER
ncbi:MAG: hypothetical protein AAB804_01195 [Patescibacteria group bacterium]